jgi:mannitol-1-phosphate 5-dehydrogenase
MSARKNGRSGSQRGRVVIIGGGKLGCGYLAPLFLDAGWECVLVARTEKRAARMRTAGGFEVRVVPGDERRTVRCPAIAFGGPAFEQAVGVADLIVTAVGVENVTALSPALARALGRRSPALPIDVWVAENADVAPVLERAVRRVASNEAITLPPIAFAGAIAYPIVARGDWSGASTPVFVRDDHAGLLVDFSRLFRALPELPGAWPTARYKARLREKLFVFGAGHHLCAYLGACARHERVDEAANDPFLRAGIIDSLLEVCSALELRDGVLRDPWVPVIDALHRYDNDALEDPIRRVARSPIRKLAPAGPLVGPAKLVCETFGRVPTPLALGIASALLYTNDRDSQARELAAMLRRVGVRAVLARVSGLEPDDPLLRAVVVAYERMCWRRSMPWPLIAARGVASRAPMQTRPSTTRAVGKAEA